MLKGGVLKMGQFDSVERAAYNTSTWYVGDKFYQNNKRKHTSKAQKY